MQESRVDGFGPIYAEIGRYRIKAAEQMSAHGPPTVTVSGCRGMCQPSRMAPRYTRGGCPVRLEFPILSLGMQALLSDHCAARAVSRRGRVGRRQPPPDVQS